MTTSTGVFMDEWVDFGGVNEAYNMAISLLEKVVRCKDCKFYRPNNPSVGCLKVVRSENADGDWFCADGEKAVSE